MIKEEYKDINDFATATLFTPKECERILKYCKKNTTLTDAKVGHRDGIDRVTKTRSSEVGFLNAEDEKSKWFRDKIADAVLAINEQKYKFEISESENIQFTKYGIGGNYGWHVDIGHSYPYCCRKLSISIQLSDDCYDGGDLMILLGGKEYVTMKKKQGQAIIFPSFIPHIVTEVEEKPGSG